MKPNNTLPVFRVSPRAWPRLTWRLRATALAALATLVAVLATLTGGAAARQNNEALPPHVIDVWPYPGEEVAIDQPVILTFDQPMDRASVEAALQWSRDDQAPGPASGSFSWQDDRTVAFIPADGWQRATRYSFTLATSAQATNGLTLEAPYDFFVQTTGFLEISAVIPAPDVAGVAADAVITVAFNRPVVPLVATTQLDDLPDPLTLEPAVEGTGEWVNTSIYQFTPAKPLPGGTSFTARIAAGLEDVTGAVLAEPYTWQFKTLPPEILSVSPHQGQTHVRLGAGVNIQFSQPMDRASTEEAFSLQVNGARVPGTLSWSEDSTALSFEPAESLQIQSTYSLNLSDTARSASGEARLEQGITYTFETVPYPGIESTSPRNGERDAYPGGGVSFYFKSPMNTETFAGKVEILEPAGVEWEPVVQGERSFYVSFATLPQTRYTLVFKAGAEDVYGNAIETDYTLTFSTRALEPWANLPSSGSFMLTNAYRDDTRVAMAVQADPGVGFSLYTIPPEAAWRVMRGGRDTIAPVTQPDNLLRAWSRTLKPVPAPVGVDEIMLASEQGGQLPPGVYYLEAQPSYTDYPQTLGLGVVTANLTVKRAPDEILVWMTDMQSAEPVAGSTVRVYSATGAVLLTGETDADGLFRAPLDLSAQGMDEFAYIIAESATDYAIWQSWREDELPRWNAYIYTDRPIYRPDQTVYFRGMVRAREDMAYSLPPLDEVNVRIDVNWGESELYQATLPLTEFGTFSGELHLPEDAALGEANISVEIPASGVYLTNVPFSIAEFRTPEYRVSVTPDYPAITAGDDIRTVFEASYYFGGPVSDADLTWNAYGQPASFTYAGPGRYTFSDATQDYFDWHHLGDGGGTTDANGRFIAELDNVRAPSSRPMTATIEGTITDESGIYISGRTSVLVHPADAYVGLRADRYFGREGTPLNLDLVAVTPQSEPLAGQQIDLTVVEIRWERVPIEGEFGRYDWERSEIEVETAEVITGADGTAQYTFTPPQAGIYRVRATTRDARERINGASLRFWVTGQRSVWWGQPSTTIDLIADQDSYQPGDTAEILVPIPFTGVSYVLVTTERAGIQSAEVVRVEGSTLLYELPITADHVPTIHVNVTLMKGVDGEESLNPSFRTGALALDVEPVEQRLTVSVTPSTTRAQPGETVSFDVQTVDARGEPVSAEVGLTVTDLAILALRPPNSGTLESRFYGFMGNYINTDVALNALLDTRTDELLKERDRLREENELAASPSPAPTQAAAAMDMAAGEADAAFDDESGAGGGGEAPVTIRENFQETPLFAPHVVTDQTGHANLSVTLPDNLTTWHVDARGLTMETAVGQAELDVMSTLPLLTRPVAPRFFVVNDRVALASVINNNTDAPQQVEARLEATGVTFESDATQTVTIEAGSRARVEWWVRIEDVPFVDLTFFAIGQDGYQDAVKPTLATGPDGTIPVYRYTAPDTVGTGGVIRTEGARTEAISLPPRLDTDQGELALQLDPSLAATTIDALNYLRNYKHQCIEQTISRFLPNVITFRALRDLGIEDPDLEANLRRVLGEALDRLATEQNPDGGWGWFRGMESNPYITAYAVLGLVEARDTGFDVDRVMLDSAINFVRLHAERPTIDTPVWRLNRLAFYAYVFARAGQADVSQLDLLLDHRLEMDYWAQSFLLMAYHQQDPANAAIPQLVSDLQTGAILSATGAHWEEDDIDWWNWSSDTRSTALALTALTRVVPDYDLLPNVVRWLMVARRGDHWQTTQETAWAVMALTDWMVASGELRGNYDYAVTINGDVLGEGVVTPETIREGEALRVEVKDLLQDAINRLTVVRSDGEGVLYYTAHLKLRLWAEEADPINRGVSVSRAYFIDGQPGTPVTEAQVGDVITVRVTMNLSQDMYYFVLEDPIPAGTEPVDTSLLTTSQLGDAPTIQPDRDPSWWWGWWLFDRTELRDEQARLYADFLPRGTYVYSYQVRASVPGEFQTMPSHAYAFYFPEVFGRGEGLRFTITPAE